MTAAMKPTAVPFLKPQRLASIDAYRGLVMFLMMAEVLRLSQVSSKLPDSAFWRFLAFHQSHVPWAGCSLHDLIQPSFSFLVGVALPFSLASRAVKGQSRLMMIMHAVLRAVILVLLGVFLRSMGKSQTNWTFEDTLSQIGFGYVPLFLLGFTKQRWQWAALAVILVGYWTAFVLYPLPPSDFNYAKYGLADWPYWYQGLAAHWDKNTNLAWAFDSWFLNLFPREHYFKYNGGGYATLSFIPTLATMILGLIAGEVLRRDCSQWAKVRWFAIAGVGGLAAGILFGAVGICPVVKRIWTPSWVLFSGGWCFLLLAAFYTVIDLAQKKSWAFPLVVIGANSIAAYLIAHLFEQFILKNLTIHLGTSPFQIFGAA